MKPIFSLFVVLSIVAICSLEFNERTKDEPTCMKMCVDCKPFCAKTP